MSHIREKSDARLFFRSRTVITFGGKSRNGVILAIPQTDKMVFNNLSLIRKQLWINNSRKDKVYFR